MCVAEVCLLIGSKLLKTVKLCVLHLQIQLLLRANGQNEPTPAEFT